MASPYVPPRVFVSYDVDEDQHVIMVENHGYSAVAGVRCFRAEPWPEIKFKHATEEAALRDAAVLRQYLDDCHSGKRKDGEAQPRGRGWWEDSHISL